MKPPRAPRARPAPTRSHGLEQRAQRGSTAVEFALIFPVFFVILYAVVTFSLIFVAQQNMTLAAEEGARAALNWTSNSSLSTALYNRGVNACAAASQMAASLVQSMTCTPSSVQCGPGNAMYCINVALSYDYKDNPLVPNIALLSMTLPNTLYASATVQLNPENIQ